MQVLYRYSKLQQLKKEHSISIRSYEISKKIPKESSTYLRCKISNVVYNLIGRSKVFELTRVNLLEL